MNGTLFFVANNGNSGQELWRSEGFPADTALVRDIDVGLRGGSVNWLTNVGGTLFFTADDEVHGVQLWKSDGTEAGTAMVADTNPDAAPEWLTDVDGTLFFTADSGG